MAPQGHNVGATTQEGACENSNLERQGCSPFYQDVTDDPYVDRVRGSLYFLPLTSRHPHFFSYLNPEDILNYYEMPE